MDAPNGALVLQFSRDVFTLDTIKKAAYRYSAELSFQFDLDDKNITLSAYPLRQLDAGALRDLEHAIRVEVLDQDLRAIVASETQPMRNAILAYAFSRTGLQSDEQI